MKIFLPILATAGMAIAFQAQAAISISTGTAAPWAVSLNSGLSAPVFIETGALPGSWTPNFGDGKWVGQAASYGSLTTGAPSGTYVYTLAIGTFSGNAGTFSFKYASDNAIAWSISNGGSLSGALSCGGSNPSANCFTTSVGAPFSLSGSYGSSSVLTATVLNASPGGSGNPSGLLVTGTALPVPEPAEWAMMLAGLSFVGLMARRRSQT